MAYETKALVIALMKIVRQAKGLDDVYEVLKDIAEAEGLTVRPMENNDAKN